MTREEASNRLKQWIRNGCDGMTDEQLGYIEGWFHKSDKEALDMAIKALEQEPKTGHWIGIDEKPHEVWECDHCGFVIDGSGCIEPYEYRDTYKYCPNCGARMVEPQESEE